MTRMGKWHERTFDEALAELDASPDGLTEAEARRRLERYGPNVVEAERAATWWEILGHQIRDPLIYILLVAAAVALLLRDYIDMAVILAVVVINALIGFIQEFRAQQAMRALAAMSAPKSTVVRGGRERQIASRDVVPGDVLVVASGSRVSADVRLGVARELEVDESALTGESVPVRKHGDPLAGEHLVPGDQLNMLFLGTIVTRGRGRGVVVRTGAETEVGRIAGAVRELGLTTTPLKQKMETLGHWIGAAVLVLTVLVFLLGAIRAMPPSEIFLVAVAIAVSAIPEGLPVVLTVALAVGVRRMAHRNAIIRALPAVETLGSTTVIASDKTGTLTANQMTVRALWQPGRRYEVEGTGYHAAGAIRLDGDDVSADDPLLRPLLLTGALANEANADSISTEEPQGDPTELALYYAAAKGGLDPAGAQREHRRLDLLPFESERRFMASLNRAGDGAVAYLKGAPEAILRRCARQLDASGTAPLDADAAHAAAHALADRGLRVLAMACAPHAGDGAVDESDLESGLVFVGLQAMEDPVRPEAVEAVAAAHRSGIRVLMVIGDHVDTARAIGRQLGLGRAHHAGPAALEGRALEAMDETELDGVLRDVEVYARVAPEHKLRIVQRLKHHGEIVAVTGDGVNDAPALRAAHLGVAMGRAGTDVAREASDMVLADDNFATITAAVEEGRVAFSNVRKVTFFLLSTGVSMPVVILVALLLGWPLPFLAAQILWINLVTNGLQDVALAFEPGEPGLLERRPRPPGEGVLTLRLLERLAGVGAILAAGTLAMFWWTIETTGDLDVARSAAMTQMVIFQVFHVLNSRSLDRSIFRVPAFSNPFLFASVLAALLAHAAVLYLPFMQVIFRTAPLSLEHWGWMALVGLTVVAGGELDKWRNRRRGTLLG